MDLFALEIELLETEMALQAYDDTNMKVEPGSGWCLQFLPDWYHDAQQRRVRLMREIIKLKTQ